MTIFRLICVVVVTSCYNNVFAMQSDLIEARMIWLGSEQCVSHLNYRATSSCVECRYIRGQNCVATINPERGTVTTFLSSGRQVQHDFNEFNAFLLDRRLYESAYIRYQNMGQLPVHTRYGTGIVRNIMSFMAAMFLGIGAGQR
jgi:hypothetical protein